MRLFDAFGGSKGAMNLVRIGVIEELMKECWIDSFIRLLCGVDDCLRQLLRLIALSKSVRDAKYVICANN